MINEPRRKRSIYTGLERKSTLQVTPFLSNQLRYGLSRWGSIHTPCSQWLGFYYLNSQIQPKSNKIYSKRIYYSKPTLIQRGDLSETQPIQAALKCKTHFVVRLNGSTPYHNMDNAWWLTYQKLDLCTKRVEINSNSHETRIITFTCL